MLLITVLISALFGVFLSGALSNGTSVPLVEIDSGVLRGDFRKTKNGREFSAFQGIPFARPPLGELRFKPPVPADPWEGVRNATEVHAVCPQRDIYRRSELIEGDEDCLYLNVYTPQLPQEGKKPLPVMVFFHGGGWLCGGGNSLWYGPDVLLDRDVVLVVTNYRLGALGFLSTGDEVVPGNNGLKDQNLALKWVQRNIAQFGGDPTSVTLFGESAGGASVYYHMVSPMSQGLFKGGIAQSGTSLCIWAMAPKSEGLENSKKLAKSFNCPTTSSEKMVECLRKVDPIEIIKKDKIFMEWDLEPMIPFKPVIEPKVKGAFLTEDPIEIVKSGRSAQVPLIVGLTTEDGALKGASTIAIPELLSDLNNNYKRILPITLMYEKTAEDIDGVTKNIRKFYFKNRKIAKDNEQQVINMYTDAWFLNCADETVRLHRKYTKAPVYYYLFAHRGTASFTEIFGGGKRDYGVCHADDLQYLFPIRDGLWPDREFTENDRKVTEMMTTFWTEFARTGNPTPEIGNQITERWNQVQTDDMEYYHIDAKSPGMRKGLYLDRAKFWRSLESNSRTHKKAKNEEL